MSSWHPQAGGRNRPIAPTAFNGRWRHTPRGCGIRRIASAPAAPPSTVNAASMTSSGEAAKSIKLCMYTHGGDGGGFWSVPKGAMKAAEDLACLRLPGVQQRPG